MFSLNLIHGWEEQLPLIFFSKIFYWKDNNINKSALISDI